MYIYLSLPYAKMHRYNEGLYKTYPQGIYRCHVLDRIRSLRSFYASKNKASSKRLSTIYVSPFQPPFLQGLRHGDKAKIKKKRKSGLKRMKKIPFQRQKSTSAERKINLRRMKNQSQPNDFSFGAEWFSTCNILFYNNLPLLYLRYGDRNLFFTKGMKQTLVSCIPPSWS